MQKKLGARLTLHIVVEVLIWKLLNTLLLLGLRNENVWDLREQAE